MSDYLDNINSGEESGENLFVFKKLERESHLHLTKAFATVVEMASSADNGVADRAREIASEAKDIALTSKGIAEYAQSVANQTAQNSLINADGDKIDLTEIQQDIKTVQDNVNMLIFELAMTGLVGADGMRNVFIDRINSVDSVQISSGMYANNKVFI